MTTSIRLRSVCAIVATGLFAPAGASAQTLKTLVNFDKTNGEQPFGMSLIQGTDGNLYGTTYTSGTIFKMTPAGALTVLATLACMNHDPNGCEPQAGLAQAANGNFYGSTTNGAKGFGTIFSITASGVVTTLYTLATGSFSGIHIWGPLLPASDGNFYGTTEHGGANQTCPTPGGTKLEKCGLIFQMTPANTVTTFHNFNGADGATPTAGLIEASDGSFYGTTAFGGANCAPYGCGTVFRITPGGALTTLHSFNGKDGFHPIGNLVQAASGELYGTTTDGGNTLNASQAGYGVIFKITTAGQFTLLHSFTGKDGASPWAGLVQGRDGNFYGTTAYGGTAGLGTIFDITPQGTLTTLYTFTGAQNGQNPYGGLVLATNGLFYGTTGYGGTSMACPFPGCGTIFSLSMGR